MGLALVACGKQETTAGKESINETVESVQEETTETDDAESTARGIKLGDSIDKVFELYGPADKYDTCTKKYFSHDNLNDTEQYTYFLKLDSTKDYFYAFTFYADQYSDVMLLMVPSMHTDFTPARVNGKCVQVSIFANPDETLYYFGEHKGHQGIAGTPVERYLQDAIDNEPELTWHKQMKDLFSEVIHEAKQTRDFSPERILQIKNKYDIIVKLASEEYEQHPPNKYFPEGFNLFKRMVAYKKNHLLFLILADV